MKLRDMIVFFCVLLYMSTNGNIPLNSIFSKWLLFNCQMSLDDETFVRVELLVSLIRFIKLMTSNQNGIIRLHDSQWKNKNLLKGKQVRWKSFIEKS